MRLSTLVRAAALIAVAGVPAQARALFKTPIPAAPLTCVK